MPKLAVHIYASIQMCTHVHIAGLRVGADEEVLAFSGRVHPVVGVGVDQADLFASGFIPVDVRMDRHMYVDMHIRMIGDTFVDTFMYWYLSQMTCIGM